MGCDPLQRGIQSVADPARAAVPSTSQIGQKLNHGSSNGRTVSPTSSARSNTSNRTSDNLPEPMRSSSVASSSTCPTSIMSTPEQLGSSVDPLSLVTPDSHPPLVSTGSDTPSLDLQSLSLLTSESLRPLDQGARPATRTTGSSSVASSSEAHDLLYPLPVARAAIKERPALGRAPASAPKLSNARGPLPSPPAMGLSELLSGSSVASSSENTSYFTSHHSEMSSLNRSNSGSKRNLQYSPFRSYYGDVPRHDGSSWDKGLAEGHLAPSRPAIQPNCTTSKARSETASSHSSSRSRRSPRIQNNDGILAPHGSFTTSRKKTADGPKMSPVTPASDSQLYLGATRRQALISGQTRDEKKALEAAAGSGDQLAMYRLGWRTDTPSGQRYQIGSIENVWGPASPNMTTTIRSSPSSRSSVTSIPGSPYQPLSSPRPHAESDLFSDAAGLALRSTAGQNHTSKRR